MLDIVKKLFGTSDLYEVLNITTKNASDEKQLRSAYLRSALRFHPDKCKDDKESTEKFQLMKKIYDLLGDEDLRKAYDETGEWPEDEQFTIEASSYGRLDENAILEFKKIYIGSDEEQEDIIRLYNEGEGDIFHIVDNLFFADILTDESRIESIIKDLLEKKKIEPKSKAVISKKIRDKKIKKAQREAKEAEEALKELGVGNSMDALAQAIQKRGAQRMDFLDGLEKKYADLEKSKTKRKGSKAKSDEATPSKKAKHTESSSRTTRSSKSK